MSPTTSDRRASGSTIQLVRRDEIVEIVEVKPLTVAEVTADRDERVLAEPTPQPRPLRA